jgi:phosphopantetheinyl transferase (holo-ACP synthase)
MIGNDIVDLLDPDAQPSERTPAFDARVFTPAEQARIAASRDGVRERWIIWAAKEAAYKLARKCDARTPFVPKRFEVKPGTARAAASPAAGRGHLQGRVSWDGGVFDCDWISAPGFVHALCRKPATPAPDCLAIERVEALGAPDARPDAPSRAVRRLARCEIARALGVDPGALEIRQTGRIPFLYLDQGPLAADLSLSHHGTRVAFACRLSPGPELAACLFQSAGGPGP